ncbi:MAG: hypothetical protein AAGA48_34205 [Myxococcota bacterium]
MTGVLLFILGSWMSTAQATIHPVWVGDAANCNIASLGDLQAQLALANPHFPIYVYVEPDSVHTLSDTIDIGTLKVKVTVAPCREYEELGAAEIRAADSKRMFTVDGGRLNIGSGVSLIGTTSLTTGDGGVIRARSSSKVNVYGSISGGHVSGHGGTIWMGGGTLALGRTATIETGISGNDGGCIWQSFGVITIAESAEVRSCEAHGDGGGIYVANVNVSSPSAARVWGNQAEYGGGIYAYYSDLSLAQLDLDENTATAQGGGLYATNSTLMMTNVRVRENNLTGLPGVTAMGAGLYAEQSSLTMRTDQSECGLYNEDGERTLDVNRFCSEIRGNSGAASGGGLAVVSNTNVTLETTALAENASGGLLLQGHSTMSAEGIVVFGHTEPASTPTHAIVVDDTSRLDLYFSTVADNAAGGAGIAYQLPGPGTPGAQGWLRANIIRDNISGMPTGDNNLVVDTTQLVGGINYNNNPEFIGDHLHSPYKVYTTSPALILSPGPGTGSTATDIDNVSRLGGADWTRGAFEAVPVP